MNDAIMFTYVWPFGRCNNYKPLQFIDISLVISHKIEAMKDERIHYGTVYKS